MLVPLRSALSFSMSSLRDLLVPISTWINTTCTYFFHNYEAGYWDNSLRGGGGSGFVFFQSCTDVSSVGVWRRPITQINSILVKFLAELSDFMRFWILVIKILKNCQKLGLFQLYEINIFSCFSQIWPILTPNIFAPAARFCKVATLPLQKISRLRREPILVHISERYI